MLSTSSAPTYKLILVQEPTTGSAFEDNLLGRIGLAPPLILELRMTKDGRIEDPSAELPFLICQCSLLNEDGSVADMVDQMSAAPAIPSSLMPPTSARWRGRRTSSNRGGSSPLGASTRSSGSIGASTASSQAEASSSAPWVGQTSSSMVRMLYGTVVAGAQSFSSVRAEEGEKPFFFFPEISVRTPGVFKIRCRLMRLAL